MERQEEPTIRTTGRIKKPKTVFDPSDNYLPRAQRLSVSTPTSIGGNNQSDRRSSQSRMSTASSDSGSVVQKEVCVVCGKRESKRPAFATKNRLISCMECESKIHKLCLKVDFEDFEQLRQKYKCDRCSPCSTCNKAGYVENSEGVLICSLCTQLYHNSCLLPKALKDGEEQARDWKCYKCAKDPNSSECATEPQDTNGTEELPVNKILEIVGGQVQTLPSTTKSIPASATSRDCSPTSELNLKRAHSNDDLKNDDRCISNAIDQENGPAEEKRTKTVTSVTTVDCGGETRSTKAHSQSVDNLRDSPNETADDDIPDVKNWSVDQVHDYFQKQFPNEAYVFKDQEIDGRSLLLLKRSDVIKKLPLKLGPSLRIYSVILKIQSQINDPTLGWHCAL